MWRPASTRGKEIFHKPIQSKLDTAPPSLRALENFTKYMKHFDLPHSLYTVTNGGDQTVALC